MLSILNPAPVFTYLHILHLSVILSTGGGVCPGGYLPHTPGQTPPGRHPLGRHPSRANTPLCSKRAVRILLECILVIFNLSIWLQHWVLSIALKKDAYRYSAVFRFAWPHYIFREAGTELHLPPPHPKKSMNGPNWSKTDFSVLDKNGHQFYSTHPPPPPLKVTKFDTKFSTRAFVLFFTKVFSAKDNQSLRISPPLFNHHQVMLRKTTSLKVLNVATVT